MGAPIPFGALAIDFLRTGPSLWRPEDDHRPARAFGEAVPARVGLNALDLCKNGVQRACHEFVHFVRLMALDKIRRITVATKKVVEFFGTNPGQNRRVGDLVSIEMQDREDHTVGDRIEELVGMPARRQRSGFRLAVAHDTGDD
jgi:hypothetical protein